MFVFKDRHKSSMKLVDRKATVKQGALKYFIY